MPHKVLLVDDEPNVPHGLKHALRKERYEILCVNSAGEALELLAREPVDVIVSDEQMPGMSGSEMFAKIRREYPETVRILLTGHTDVEGVLRAINEGGIYRFLQKPCNALDLAITIRKALEQKEWVAQSHALLQAVNNITLWLQELQKKHSSAAEEVRKSMRNVIFDSPLLDPDAVLAKMGQEVRKIKQLFGYVETAQNEPQNTPSTTSSTVKCAEEQAAHTQTPNDPVRAQTSPENQENSSHSNASESAPTLSSKKNARKIPSAPGPIEPVTNIKELKPLISRTEIQDLLDDCSELKALSPTVGQILKLTQSSRCSIEQVVKVVKQDHAVSLKILKLAPPD